MSDPHICVVMAVCNRMDSVWNALHAWSLQTCDDFSMVVADDGSEDDILSVVKIYDKAQYYCGQYGNVAVMLNKGTLLAPEQTTHLWFTDGDIIFNPQAVEKAYGHIAERPDRVITGRYDWLPAMRILPFTVEHRFQNIVDCTVPRLPMETGYGGLEVPGQERHADHRLRDDPQFFEHKLLDTCRPLLGANIIVPLDAWCDVGGWDENIPGANANDCDFGWDLTDAGYEMLTCECIVGYHQYHPRNGEAMRQRTAEALRYIFAKHHAELPAKWREDAEGDL